MLKKHQNISFKIQVVLFHALAFLKGVMWRKIKLKCIFVVRKIIHSKYKYCLIKHVIGNTV